MTTTMSPARTLVAQTCRFSNAAAKHTTYSSRASIARHADAKRRNHTQAPRRRLHSTTQKEIAVPLSIPSSTITVLPSLEPSTTLPPLSCLPLSHIFRTYFITAISSQPALLGASTMALRTAIESNNPLFDLRNPLMKYILHETFYKQFCGGWDEASISKTTNELRSYGYAGVILEYAREVLKEAEGDELEDVGVWKKGMLDTIGLADSGDFTALKWSGLGSAAMRRMKAEGPPSKAMEEAMHTVCQAAASKDIALLPSAEETSSLRGYHKWTLDLQRAYNVNGKSVLYNTYQTYLKQTPSHVARHLQMAKDEGFTLGVKLVRGAYLGSEQRDVIWPSIEATHQCYDSTTSAMVHRQYNDSLKPSGKTDAFPDVNVVIASHNAATVEKTQAWRQKQASRGEDLTPLIFAQLQGMADEVSCSLLANAKANQGNPNAVQERVFKSTTWGTMYECLNYLLRRAAENKDAAGRTSESRDAMGAELGRRFKAMFRMS